MSSIDLGFARPLQPNFKWKLKNKFFPSKIGGKPAFLALRGLPTANSFRCLKCHQIMKFLLQIYAPIDGNDNAFHRTLFLFCCPNNDCNQFKVLRSQLSRHNPYYRSDPPDYDCDDLSYDPKPQALGIQLCAVCGLPSDKKCAKCQKVSYCSKDHQIVDWKAGQHKVSCGTESSPQESAHESLLFAESELIIEDGDSSADTGSEEGGTDSEDEAKEAEEMQKYNELIRNCDPEYQTQNLDNYEENVSEEQKVFNKFKRISTGELIRYCSYDTTDLKVEPLWLSNKDKPDLEIPKCDYCGSGRRFEFQVMPQILNQINRSEESLDFGTLVVYTCSKSCSIGSDNEQYKEEYVWKQSLV